jgi:MFS family permease
VTGSTTGFGAQLRSYPGSFWVANVMEIFERMAWYGFYAVAALYITGPKETGALGFTSVQRGNILGIVQFFLYIFPVVTGALADRYGYKKMFIISYLGMVVSYYLLGEMTSVPGFFTAFMLVAVAAAIFKPLVVGTVARVTDGTNSSTGFGIFYMMVNIGGFLGPIVAGAVRGLSWDYVFIACSGWAAVNLVVVLVFYKEPTTEAGSAGARTLRKVMDDAVEVLGNLRFFIAVFVVLVAMMIPGFRWEWFTWKHCLIFIVVWLALNGLWDLLMPRGSGLPVSQGGPRRNPLLKRMHCGNWRFALFLLIMSGFWTSFNQIFLTMPEYIRDYTDTSGMVRVGRAVFGALGKPGWIDRLAAIEEAELLAEFGRLVRRAKGREPMVESKPTVPETAPEGSEPLSAFPGLSDEDIDQLERIVRELNAPSAEQPVTVHDLVASARRFLQYKVRVTPVELGDLMVTLPDTPPELDEEQLDAAAAAVNRRIENIGKEPFEGADADRLRDALRRLVHTSRWPSGDAVANASAALSDSQRTLEPDELAVGVRVLAYRQHIWDEIDAARQVNPEHVINFDALSIVLLQVFISYLMARFHRFTAMITGMVVATFGICLWALAGGTMIGPVGGSLLLVIFGILFFSIGEMMASPTSQEYVGRTAPRDKSALYMGYYFITIALGNLFGGLLSGEMYELFGREMRRPDLLWLVFAGVMLLTAITFLLYNRFALPKPRPAGEA